MILQGIRDREMRTPRDLNRATLGKFGEYKYLEFQGWRLRLEHLSVSEYRVGGRDTLNPASEIDGYTSREGISWARSPRHQ